MKDHTKQHFDAPWQKRTVLDIETASGIPIGGADSLADTNRFLLIPELYDALEEAIFEINRLTEAWENGEQFPDYLDSCLAENKKLPHENTMEWAILLGKVWNGEEQDK